MLFLPRNFVLLTVAGFWEPVTVKSRSSLILLKLYSFTIHFLTIILLGMKFYNLVTAKSQSLKDFLINTFLFPEAVTAYVKGWTVIFKKKYYFDVERIMLQKCCLRHQSNEVKVQEKYDKICGYVVVILLLYNLFIYFILINTITTCRRVTDVVIIYLVLLMIQTIAQSLLENSLPVLNWYTYDITSAKIYWLTYLHELICFTLMVMVHVTFDAIVISYMLQLCAQLEILQERLGKIALLDSVEQYKVIIENVNHHTKILR